MDKNLITEADQARKTLGKRSLPGELEATSNGWDAVRPTKRKSKKGTPSTPRTSKLMLKGQNGV